MAQYHIADNGKPARCKATKKPCPKGGQHFPSKETAKFYAETVITYNAKEVKKLAHDFLKTPEGKHFDPNSLTLNSAGDGFTLRVVKPISELDYNGVSFKQGDLFPWSDRDTLHKGMGAEIAAAAEIVDAAIRRSQASDRKAA